MCDGRTTIWSRSVHSITHPDGLQHPLASDLTIFQLHSDSHYTTAIYDTNGMRHYNSLPGNPPRKIRHIRQRLSRYYRNRNTDTLREKTAGLSQPTRTMATRRQTDAFTCAMHMLAVTLSCTYQKTLPTLAYSNNDILMLHRHHLRHYITGQLGPDAVRTDWLAGFVALLKNPSGTTDYTPPHCNTVRGWCTNINTVHASSDPEPDSY